jgi:hypothetical protein
LKKIKNKKNYLKNRETVLARSKARYLEKVNVQSIQNNKSALIKAENK